MLRRSTEAVLVIPSEKVLFSWLDSSRTLIWIVSESIEAYDCRVVKISKWSWGLKEQPAQRTTCLRFYKTDITVNVWQIVNMIAIHVKNKRQAYIYQGFSFIPRKILALPEDFATLIGVTGFIHNDVVTAVIVFCETYAVIYILQNISEHVVSPAYILHSSHIESIINTKITQGVFQNISHITPGNFNTCYFVCEDHVMQLKLVSFKEIPYFEVNHENYVRLLSAPTLLNKTLASRILYYFFDVGSGLLRRTPKKHSILCAVYLVHVMSFSQGCCHHVSLLRSRPIRLYVKSLYITHVLDEDIKCVELLWIVTSAHDIVILRLWIHEDQSQREPLFIYKLGTCHLKFHEINFMERCSLFDLFSTSRNDLCILWRVACDHSQAGSCLRFSIISLPFVVNSPMTPPSSLSCCRVIEKTINMVDIPCDQHLCNFVDLPSCNEKEAAIMSLGDCVSGAVWKGTQFLQQSFLYHKNSPRYLNCKEISQEITWKETHSLQWIGYLSKDWSSGHKCAMIVRRYQFFSTRYLLMECSKAVSLEDSTIVSKVSVLLSLLKVNDHKSIYALKAGAGLLYGRFRCLCCIRHVFNEQLLMWALEVAFQLLQFTEDPNHIIHFDKECLFNIIINQKKKENSIFNLVARFRFEFYQLHLCFLYGLKLRKFWTLQTYPFLQQPLDQVTQRILKMSKLTYGTLYIIYLSECWNCLLPEIPWNTLASGALLWLHDCMNFHRSDFLDKSFKRLFNSGRMLRHLRLPRWSLCLYNFYDMQEKKKGNLGNTQEIIPQYACKDNISASCLAYLESCCYFSYLRKQLDKEFLSLNGTLSFNYINHVELFTHWDAGFAAYFGEIHSTMTLRNLTLRSLLFFACLIGATLRMKSINNQCFHALAIFGSSILRLP